MIATGDVGLLPWVPLAKFEGSPEQIVSRCRAHIDHAIASAEPEKRARYENLLAVTRFLLPLRYHKGSELLGRLRDLLGGRKAMIESPLYQEIVEESERKGETKARRQDILKLLVIRFGDSANDLKVEMEAVDYDRLEGLFEQAAGCYDLASFREQLLS